MSLSLVLDKPLIGAARKGKKYESTEPIYIYNTFLHKISSTKMTITFLREWFSLQVQ